MCFIGVEVEQETSAPPPKKNPGSAPAFASTIDHQAKYHIRMKHASAFVYTFGPPIWRRSDGCQAFGHVSENDLFSLSNTQARVMQAPCPGEGWGAYVTQAQAAAKQTNLHPKPETPCYNRLTEPYKPALCSQ